VNRLAEILAPAHRDGTTIALLAPTDVGGAVRLTPEIGQPLQTELIDELKRWTSGLIEQAAKLDDRAKTEALEAAKLAALAEFAAGAGHEINNPLATISGRVQLLLRDETDPERRRSLTTIGGQAYRIRDMIGDVMLFADPPVPDMQATSFRAALDAVAASFLDKLETTGCSLKIDVEGNPEIWADQRQLEILLACLLQNSLDASSPGDVVRIATSENVGKEFLKFAVIDRGVGISETVRPHLFDPFFSGRQAGRGLGFGLSKCWRIVTNHRGRISVKSVPGGETTFEVFWPTAPQPS